MTDLSLVDSAFDSVGSAGDAALDTVVGGAAMAVDTARRPRRAATRARRRGDSVTDSLVDTAEDAVDTATALPGRVVLAYLRGLRRQARRDDPLGAAARTILGAVHGSARDWARFLARVERETDVRGTRTARRPATRATAARRTTRGTTARGRATSSTRGGTSRRGGTTRRSTGTRRRTSR